VHLASPLLSGDVEDVVATNERIAILVLQLASLILFSLFKRYVHESVKTREDPSVINSRVQLDHNRLADNLL